MVRRSDVEKLDKSKGKIFEKERKKKCWATNEIAPKKVLSFSSLTQQFWTAGQVKSIIEIVATKWMFARVSFGRYQAALEIIWQSPGTDL